jgi:hypothetical protein
MQPACSPEILSVFEVRLDHALAGDGQGFAASIEGLA